MRVKCYYNLRKQCISVMFQGRVIEHTSSIYLTDVEFRVSQTGRERVLRERQKNVHAFVVGEYTPGAYPQPAPGWEEVSYNPYKAGNFYYRHGEEPIYNARHALIDGKNVYVS